MRVFFTISVCLLSLHIFCQDLSGIWRGNFVSANNKMADLFNLEDRYKYEVQIDQSGKEFTGVTYSYKTTVFYGKASANGTVNPKTGKVILNELKLLELKMSDQSYACWMICFLQYSKNGDEEFLEGRYSSYRESDSTTCGRGNVSLRKVVTSDFYREPFLAKREKEKREALTKNSNNPPSVASAEPPIKKPAIANKPVAKLNAVNTARTTKPVSAPIASAKTPVKKPVTANHPIVKTNPDIAKNKEIKSSPLDLQITPEKKMPVIKMKDPTILPSVLRNRDNELVQTIIVNSNEVNINIYDNGTIDHDTISVYLDKKLVINHQMLTTNAINLKFKMDETTDYHELIMVADNLGDIPPNTSLMVIKAGDKQYEVSIASTEQKNAVVIFKFEKPK
jgi:hypothetical protein